MSDDKHDRARELERKLMADDTEKDNQLMDAIGKIADAVSGLGKRMDAYEEKAKPAAPRRPLGETIPADEDDSDLAFEKLHPDDQQKLIGDLGDEMGREPGKARRVAADAWNSSLRADSQHDRETIRHSMLLSAQARADEVFQEFGMRAPPPLMGEKVTPYRVRVLKKLVRFSPSYKNVDLKKIPSDALAVAERQIFADAMVESRAPTDLAPGELRMVEKKVGPHIHREFYGQPAQWMHQFAGPVQMRATGKWLHDGLGQSH